MNIRNTAFLFALCLTILWLFGVMLAYKKVAVEETRVVPTLSPKSGPGPTIDQVTIERAGEKDRPPQEFDFVLKGGNWYFKSGKNDSAAIRVENQRVQSIISDIKGAVKNDDERVPSDNGVDKPRMTVTLKGKLDDQEKIWKLMIGNSSTEGSMVFARSSDKPERVVAVAKSSLDNLFFIDLKSFRSMQPITVKDEDIKEIVVKEGKDELLDVKKSADNAWTLVKPPYGPADYDSSAAPAKKNPHFPEKEEPEQKAKTGVKGLIDRLKALRVENQEDLIDPKADVDFAVYGLDDNAKDAWRIELKLEDKKDETLIIGKKVDERYFARLASDPAIFKLPSIQIDGLKAVIKDARALRSKSILLADAKKVDLIKLKAGGEDVVLSHPDNAPWDMRVGDSKAVKADQPSVTRLTDALAGKLQSFADDKSDADLGLDNPRLTMEIFTDAKPKAEEKPKTDDKKETKKDEKKDEKKDLKPAAKLFFGKIDDNGIAVKRVEDGQVYRFYLSKDLKDVFVPTKLSLAFLDRELPQFDPAQVVSITVERPKDEKEKILKLVRRQGDRWLIEKPAISGEENLAETGKVNARLSELVKMQAVQWVGKADDAALTKNGLKPADVTVTLALRKTRAPAVVSALGLLSIGTTLKTLDAAAAFAANAEADYTKEFSAAFGKKEETIVIRFGNVDKDKGTYALFEVEEGKEKARTNDLLFLARSQLATMLNSEDIQDRSRLDAMQGVVDFGTMSLLLQPALTSLGSRALLIKARAMDKTVLAFDPAKIKEVKLDTRKFELRKFDFVSQGKAKPKEPTKDKTKTKDVGKGKGKDKEPAKPKMEDKAKTEPKAEPAAYAGQNWKDKSGLQEFNLDSAKVNSLVDSLSKLQADRVVALVDAPRPYYKFGSTAKVDLIMDSGQVVTLKVGARYKAGYFAQVSSKQAPPTDASWSPVVFIISANLVNDWLEGPAYFGKVEGVARD